MVVMAGVRIVMLFTMERRVAGDRGTAVPPSRGATGLTASGGRVGGRRDELLQRLARQELEVAATTIGITPDAIRHAVDTAEPSRQ